MSHRRGTKAKIREIKSSGPRICFFTSSDSPHLVSLPNFFSFRRRFGHQHFFGVSFQFFLFRKRKNERVNKNLAHSETETLWLLCQSKIPAPRWREDEISGFTEISANPSIFSSNGGACSTQPRRSDGLAMGNVSRRDS